jgi:hypothetical protein
MRASISLVEEVSYRLVFLSKKESDGLLMNVVQSREQKKSFVPFCVPFDSP